MTPPPVIVNDGSLANITAAPNRDDHQDRGNPCEFFPAHRGDESKDGYSSDGWRFRAFRASTQGRLAGSHVSRTPAGIPLQRAAGPPPRFTASACRLRAAFPDPQFWLPGTPAPRTSQSSAPFGNNGPHRQVARLPRALVPGCRSRPRSPAPALPPAALRKGHPTHSLHGGALALFVRVVAPPPAEFRYLLNDSRIVEGRARRPSRSDGTF